MQCVVSASTVLRAARLLPPVVQPVPEVIGVDDFAFRRGHVYGTVIVNLETRKPIDLLPDRSAGTLTTWLKQHPHIKIVSRDRSSEYKKGICEGAPTAQQVLDRWHVLKNCREALERQLGRDRTAIFEICQEQVPVPPPPRTQSEQLRQTERQQERQNVFDHIHTLSSGGRSQRAISRKLHLSRGRVRSVLTAKMPPPSGRRQRLTGILKPFLPHLQAHTASSPGQWWNTPNCLLAGSSGTPREHGDHSLSNCAGRRPEHTRERPGVLKFQARLWSDDVDRLNSELRHHRPPDTS